MTSEGAVRSETRRTWFLVAATVALAALIRVLSFRGYTTYDAAEYTRLAHMLLSGEYRPGMVWFFRVFPVRVGLFAPVALMFRLVGVNELTLTAYPFLLSLLGVAIAFFAARAMFNTRAGITAALLMALLPIDARHASQLLPDMPAAIWMNAGVLLVLAGSRADALPRKAVLGALAGLTLFISWLCKETVLFLLPFLGAYLVWLAVRNRRNLTLLAATAAAACLLVALEGLVYYRYTWNFLYRFHTLVGNSGAGADRLMPVVTMSNIGACLAHRATVLAQDLIIAPFFAFIPLAALLACAYALMSRSRQFLFPGLWFGWLLLLFGFGSASIRGYFPLELSVSRHQYPLLLPAALLVGGFAGSLFAPRQPNEPTRQHRRRMLWGTMLCVCLAGMSLAMDAWGTATGLGRRSQATRNLSQILMPTDRLYTDPHTAIGLDFFWGFPAAESTHSFERMRLSELPSGVYVFFNPNELDRIGGNTTFTAPEFLNKVPPTWQKLRERDNATLYWVPAR